MAPVFYTDPSITTRGIQPPEDFLSRFLQLQQIAEAREDRGLRRREALLRLRELERQAVEGEATRRAMTAGVRPGLQVPQGREGRLGVDIPASFDRQTALQALAQGEAAHLVPGVQADFAGQDAAMQKQRLEIAEALTKLETSQLANTAKKADIMGSLAQSVLINPASYPQAKQTAEQLGLVQPGFLPEQFSPEMIPQLQGWAAQAMEVKDMVAMEKKGREPVPGRDIPLPPEVEEQRKRMNAARAQQNGLSPQQFSKVQSLASSFDSNPVVKRYNEQVNRATGVQQILAGTWSGPGDMATVFEFMKALDPESVVRESEYATAADTGNIFKGWAARFNGLIRPEGGFLSEQVKKDFADILRKKVQTSTEQVRAMHSDFARRIDKITGQGDGSEYLTDYSKLYQGLGAGQGGTQPQAGRVEVNTPGGSFFFATQAEADAFKKEAGIP